MNSPYVMRLTAEKFNNVKTPSGHRLTVVQDLYCVQLMAHVWDDPLMTPFAVARLYFTQKFVLLKCMQSGEERQVPHDELENELINLVNSL